MAGAFDRFVGIPYVEHGRDIGGVDCYGLVRLVFAELRSIELPSYVEHYQSAADARAIAALIKGELEPWDEISPGDEQIFDGVLLREAGFVRHVGLVTAPGQLLHVERGETSRIERYHSGTLRHRVVGFFRFRDAA